jgi:hypothetical protein
MRRGRRKTVCARGAYRALLAGRSTSPLDNMRDRHQYDLAFALVREAVAQWDPLGLIGGGAPADEWDAEVARLLPRLQRARSVEEAGAAVTAVFGQALGSDGPDAAACAKFGQELHSRLTSAGLIDA